MSSHDLETTIQLPNEEDVDVIIEFEVTYWGSPGHGPSWNDPGEPPEGPEFEITKIRRTDCSKDITEEVITLPGKWSQDIFDLVSEHIYELDQDRGHGYDD